MKLVTKLKIATSVFYLLSACTNKNLFKDDKYEFPGLSSLEKKANGRWQLLWDRVPTDGVTYSIYAKNKNDAYDFNKPTANVSENGWLTPSLTFEEINCFVVRFNAAQILDLNTKELCTDGESYTFKGLSAISPNDDGTILLSWDGVPITDPVSYNIFTTSTPGDYDFTKPLASVTTAHFVSPVFPIDKNRCFVVRFVFPGVADTNFAETCTKTSVLSDFIGISTATSPDTGVAEVSWTQSTNTEVAGYRIFLGTDFKNPVLSVDATKSTARISNLPTDAASVFGVRAYDKYGREDSNTKTISTTIVNLLPPSFGGIQNVTTISATGALLTWVQAGGSVASYKIYKGSVDANETQPSTQSEMEAVIDWTTPVATSSIGTATSYAVSNLGDDQYHYFAVRAATGTGIEDQNKIIRSMLVPNNGAATFAGITSLTNAGGKGQMTWEKPHGQVSQFIITWTKVSGATNSATINAKSGGVLVTSFLTPSRLDDNSTYVFVVKSVDRYNNQDSNAATRSLTLSDTTPPAQLTSVVSQALSETSVRFTFNKSTETDFSNYLIQQCVGITSACTSSASFSNASTTFSTVANTVTATVTGLIAKTTYTFNLHAVDSSSNPSDAVQVELATLDLTPPTFSGVTSVDINSQNLDLLRLTWPHSQNTDMTTYYVFVGANVDLSSASLNTTGGLAAGITRYAVTASGTWATPTMSPAVTNSALSYSSGAFFLDLPNLTQTMGTTYYIKIWAADNASPANVNQNSVQVSKLIPTVSPPSAPTFTGAWSAPDGGVKLTWNNIAEAQQYTIYRAVVGQSFASDSAPTAVVSAGTLQYVDAMAAGTNDGNSYKYRVKAKTGTLYSSNSTDTGSITIPDRVAPTFAGAITASYSGTTGFITVNYGSATDSISGMQRFQVYARGLAGVTTITAGNSYSLGTRATGTTSVTIANSGAGANLMPAWAFETGQKYNFRIEAEDNAGNISSTSWSGDVTYGVDLTPATLTVNAIPGGTVLGTGQSYTLAWSVNKAGTLYLKCNNITMKNQAITQSEVNSSTYPTVQISYTDLTTVCTGTGPKTIQYSFIDSGGLANGNTVTDGAIALTIIPSSSVLNLKLYKVGVGASTGMMVLKWTNPSFITGDTIKILRKPSATTPTSATDGTVIASGLSQSTTSFRDYDVGTVGNRSYAAFVCNMYGTCSTSVTSNRVAFDADITSFQNLSVGGAVEFKWSVSAGAWVRLAVSTNRAALENWDGVSTSSAISIAGGGWESSVSTFTSGTDASPYASANPWEKRYFRLSVANNNGDVMFGLSEIRTWARVPPGMVFVAKEEWPQSEYGKNREVAFDYAIDKFEVYETTSATNAGGNSGSAAYPNTYNSVLKSAQYQTPAVNMDWYRFKQGCYNRTLEPELLNFVVGTSTTLSPRRQVHLATDLEWFVGAAGTPDTSGFQYCNTDNRVPNAPFAGGGVHTHMCLSKFGAENMIGNVHEFTDGYYANITGSAVQTRQTYFGTPFVISETTPHLPYTGFVSSFDFLTALPQEKVATTTNTEFFQDAFYHQTGNVVTMRGGIWNGAFEAGRFFTSLQSAPSGYSTAIGGRCAIAAPAPRITKFQNDSEGNLARFYWNVSNPDNEGTLNVVLAFGSDADEIEAWSGETTTFTNGGTITFSTSAGNQSFSSSSVTGLSACASYTPVATGFTGKCSLDLPAAPFNLSPWQKRFFKLYASNTNIGSGGPGPGAVSTTAGVGYVPPGMVLVAKEDWPIENAATTLGWDYKTGSAVGTTYDGVVGPFDYAIDKYEASWKNGSGIGSNGANICNTSGSDSSYPNNFSCVTTSAANTPPPASRSWYNWKQACENRTIEPEYASFVGNTTLARTATTQDPRRRVHLTTDAEWTVAAFQTSETYLDCNTVSATVISSGTSATKDCISRYGAFDMVGNAREFTDGSFSAPHTSGTRVTFSGTGFEISKVLTLPAVDSYIGSFSFLNSIVQTTSSVPLQAFGLDNFSYYHGGSPISYTRGGVLNQSSNLGRFSTMTWLLANTDPGLAGRCALVAPTP